MRSNPRYVPVTEHPEQLQYQTIRNTSRSLGISEHCLRKLLKDGKLPGFFSGNRFMVDTDSLKTAVRLGDL